MCFCFEFSKKTPGRKLIFYQQKISGQTSNQSFKNFILIYDNVEICISTKSTIKTNGFDKMHKTT